MQFSRLLRLLAEEEAAQQDQERRGKRECLIEKVMAGAEQHLHQYLRKHQSR
ncbi:hypothetical protein [Brevibacillus borstelensis]|uniref:hypothetical protein n=1 Tax=Brevibacillus borstelensis TaxID=45462 RepID=UPI000AFAF186|nr:hypothetical protein [Brevibacillus borstelensis]